MEVGLKHHQINKSSGNPEETKLSEEVENGDSRGGGEAAAKEAEKASDRDAVIDINGGDDGGSRNSTESSKAEKVCRICHFSCEDSSGGSELIPLGCDCRGELAAAHPNCAEAWFSQKGNRLCEICGKTAKNVIGSNDEEAAIFMMEWNEMRLVAAAIDSSSESSRRCKKSFCNFFLACLLLAFILPWFFRGTDMF